ncbi:hypothetical protein M9Y10_031199 [Tritrichomonas musculus]|uniref:Protein kinase domain-containing protein n=1 Tax=Tritrichomonas musculus TaxID=1915356 RepID=A0ABR2H215_9EUKA
MEAAFNQSNILRLIPQIDDIQDEVVNKIYSNFNFYQYQCEKTDIKEETIDKSNDKMALLNILNKINLFTYEISYVDNNLIKILPNIEVCFKNDANYTFINIAICIESICLIIENIDSKIFSEILNETNSIKINVHNDKSKSLVNANVTIEDNIKCFNQSHRSMSSIIMKNKFISKTINPILAFLIERHFYPSYLFNNKSFYLFDNLYDPNNNNNSSSEHIVRHKIYDYFISNKQTFTNNLGLIHNEIKEQFKQDDFNKLKKESHQKSQLYRFEEEEFIIIRMIYSTGSSLYYLVMHKKTLYLFLMKKVGNIELMDDYEHEIEFCENYSHRCFCRFYGFLFIKRRKGGFIYEFMSNGSLSNFNGQRSNEMNKLYSFLAICRVFQGIEYLHSNNLIHRDIKPGNILIDHDNIPYISDFETIRNVPLKEEEDCTQNIGSILYTSPEQDSGSNLTFESDIYSYGLVIYFLFEKDHYFINGKPKTDDIIVNIDASENINSLFHSCVKYDCTKRSSIIDIGKYIDKEFNIISFVDEYYCEEKTNNQYLEKIPLLYEILYWMFFKRMYFYDGDINLYFCLIRYPAISMYEHIADYFSGMISNEFYPKAKKFYELCTTFKNPRSYYRLGKIYQSYLGVQGDIIKAIEYYKLAYENNFTRALYDLALIYENDEYISNTEKANEYLNLIYSKCDPYFIYDMGMDCLHTDYSKALKCFEIASKKYFLAYLQLGIIYENGFGVERDSTRAKQYFDIYCSYDKLNFSYSVGSMYEKGEKVPLNYYRAREYFQQAASHNHPLAFFELGKMYECGRGGPKDFKLSEKCFDEYIRMKGESKSLRVGNLYKNGLDTFDSNYSNAKKYYNRALKYYETLAKENDPKAFYHLGLIYENGQGVQINSNKAQEFLIHYCQLTNDIKTYYRVGELYELKGKVLQNYSKVRYYFEIYIEKYSSNKDIYDEYSEERSLYIGALEALGVVYENGNGVQRDSAKAREYFHLLGQETSDYRNIGDIYEYGFKEVKQDHFKAMEYYELAVKNDESEALFELGKLYENGKGGKQDSKKAQELFEKYGYATNSFDRIGKLYDEGVEVKHDYFLAKKYYELGNKLDHSKCLWELGKLYEKGEGVKRDYLKAKEYYELSIKFDDSRGFVDLAKMYKYGKGVVIDYYKAKKLLELSIHYAKNNFNMDFMMNHVSFKYIELGDIYLNGKGCKKDYNKALECFENSVETKNYYGLYKIGEMYEYGLGVEKDITKAQEYYKLCAQENNGIAFYKLGEMFEKNNESSEKIKLFYAFSANKNNSNALLKLGDIYSEDDLNQISKQEAIKCYLKCKDIYENKCNYDTDYVPFIDVNSHIADNNLALIHLIIDCDIKKAHQFLKDSMSYDYPFAKNNYGLLLEMHFKDIETAKYMYERSSKSNFSLSEYNLANLLEKEGNLKESINYYKRASDHENDVLVYRGKRIEDKRLEISKKFIICLTNLKLVDYYLAKSNYIKTKKYFIRSLSKLIDNEISYKFKFIFNQNQNSFSYLWKFIYEFPLFHLSIQPNLEEKSINGINDSFEVENNNLNNACKINQKIINACDSFDYDVSYEKLAQTQKFDQMNLLNDNMKTLNHINEAGSENLIGDFNVTFEDSEKLFDFVIQNKFLLDIFHQEIKDIIEKMRKILYIRPYQILFGRIFLNNKPNISIPLLNPSIKDINEIFYEGFGIPI